MSNTTSKELKVEIIDDINSDEYEQLKELMKKFIIDTYIREDLRFSNLERSEQNRIINDAIERFDNPVFNEGELTSVDIEEIKERIEGQIRNMNEDITKPNVRYFSLKDSNKVVAFQHVYIQEGEEDNKGKIEGHIARSYTETEYRRKGTVITKSGEKKEGSFSKILIEDVKEWFSENGVTHEQIGSGENVFYNMETYIAKWGFIPFERNYGTIYMERDVNNPIQDKNVLKKIFQMCVKNRKRTEVKTAQDIKNEIEESEELELLPNDIKRRLVQVFLKDDERQVVSHKQLRPTITTEQIAKKTINAPIGVKQKVEQVERSNIRTNNRTNENTSEGIENK